MSRISKSILLVVACAALAISAVVYVACRDHSGYFKRTKGKLASARIVEYESDSRFTRHRVTLQSDSGLKVGAALLVPRKELPGHRYPVVVLLAGLETGKHAVDYVRHIPDIIIAATDYPYALQDLDTPRRVATQMLPLRKAALETVPSVMLLMDYLLQRPDTDPEKIVLVGMSLGAIFVPCLTVEDRRPAIAVMAFGGGDLRRMIEQSIGDFSGELETQLLSFAGGMLLRPLEPMRYADRISPVPLVMINGTRDDIIPRQCTEEFFNKARSPKKLIWLDASHISPGNSRLTMEVVETLERELNTLQVLVPAARKR